ncbi:hypothetical protein J6590_001891 [Homalodisca vitripennis]|nr:hypothetical protein J6590_001891 [Homalodisca vitripennis]
MTVGHNFCEAMKKLDIARLLKAQRMATEVAKKSRQARSSARRKLEDQWEDGPTRSPLGPRHKLLATGNCVGISKDILSGRIRRYEQSNTSPAVVWISFTPPLPNRPVVSLEPAKSPIYTGGRRPSEADCRLHLLLKKVVRRHSWVSLLRWMSSLHRKNTSKFE